MYLDEWPNVCDEGCWHGDDKLIDTGNGVRPETTQHTVGRERGRVGEGERERGSEGGGRVGGGYLMEEL